MIFLRFLMLLLSVVVYLFNTENGFFLFAHICDFTLLSYSQKQKRSSLGSNLKIRFLFSSFTICAKHKHNFLHSHTLNNISQGMLTEIQKGKQDLIVHIEAQLSLLKAKRQLMDANKSKISRPEPAIILQAPQDVKINEVEKNNLHNKLASLQKLYETKKQLQKVGIQANDPAQIVKYQNDPKVADYVRRKKEEKNQMAQKQLIIQQQLIKAERFLASKKRCAKQYRDSQEMNYRQILKDRAQLMDKYGGLIMQGRLNRVEKDELITMSFKMIEETNKQVRLSTLRSFLLANPEFCNHFHITHQEINRDLQVHPTKEKGVFNQIQFTQFLKSIEITSQALKPSLNHRLHKTQHKIVTKQIISQEVSDKAKQSGGRQLYRKILEYLRKIFKNLDRFRENIVRRNQYLEALQKGMYLDPSKDKEINKEELKMLSSFIKAKSKEKKEKNYYNQLDSKFINFGEIQILWKSYSTSKIQNTEVNKRSSQRGKQTPASEQVFDKALNQSSEFSEGELQDICHAQIMRPHEAKKALTQQDFKHYGWTHGSQGQSLQNTKKSLSGFDEYWKKAEEKYGQFMHQREQEDFRANFQELEAFIKFAEGKAMGKTTEHLPVSVQRLKRSN